jgi:hypothetical protein
MWSVDQQLLYILRVDLRSGGHGEPRATVRRRGGPANEAPRGVVWLAASANRAVNRAVDLAYESTVDQL